MPEKILLLLTMISKTGRLSLFRKKKKTCCNTSKQMVYHRDPFWDLLGGGTISNFEIVGHKVLWQSWEMYNILAIYKRKWQKQRQGSNTCILSPLYPWETKCNTNKHMVYPQDPFWGHHINTCILSPLPSLRNQMHYPLLHIQLSYWAIYL